MFEEISEVNKKLEEINGKKKASEESLKSVKFANVSLKKKLSKAHSDQENVFNENKNNLLAF